MKIPILNFYKDSQLIVLLQLVFILLASIYRRVYKAVFRFLPRLFAFFTIPKPCDS